jgi:hypothetical protein
LDMLASPGYAAHVLRTLKEEGGFLRKGPRVRLCIWSSWLEVAQDWDRLWHSRALIMIFVGIKVGYLQRGDAARLRVSRPKVSAKDADEGSAAHSNKQVNALRSKAHNQLHAATLVMLDSRERRRARVICTVCKPCQRWQAKQVTANRSAAECGSYYLANACGSFLGTMQDVFMVLSTPADLQHMGMKVGRLPTFPDSGHLEAYLEAEQDWTKLIVDMVFHTVVCRMRRLLWHWAGAPGIFALFLGGSDCQALGLARMKELWEIWSAAVAQPANKELQKRLDRSFMHWEVVKHVFRLGLKSGFQVCSPAMVAQAEDIYMGLGQTKVLEDGMGRFRRAEKVESENKAMTTPHIWVAPIRSKVLSQMHRYTEVDGACVQLGASDPSWLPSAMFHPRKRQASLNMAGIVSTKLGTDWPSFSPQSAVQVYADMAVFREARDQDSWQDLDMAWLCLLLRPGCLYKKAGSATWYFSLGTVWGSSALGWPAAEAGHGMLFPKMGIKLDELSWMTVLDPEVWVCRPVEWLSPAHAQHSMGARVKGLPVGVKAKPTGSEEPLLVTAARNAFYEIPLPGIKRILSLVPHGDCGRSLFDHVQCLVRALLPQASEADILHIMMKRIKAPPPTEAALFTDDILEDCFDQADADAVKEYLGGSEKPSQAEYQAEFVQHRKAYEKSAAAMPKKRGRPSSASSSAAGQNPNRQYPKSVPTSFTVEQVSLCMPPGAKCFTDRLENRFRVHCTGWGVFSRSWTLWGEEEAFRMCAAWAWNIHKSTTGESCPIPGVLDASEGST